MALASELEPSRALQVSQVRRRKLELQVSLQREWWGLRVPWKLAARAFPPSAGCHLPAAVVEQDFLLPRPC